MKFAKRVLKEFINPIYTLQGIGEIPTYLKNLFVYQKVTKEQIPLRNIYPQLHDRTGNSPIDPHYFYANAWASRLIRETNPLSHLDIGSQTQWVSVLSSFIPVIYLDFRPLQTHLPGLSNMAGDILNLPFANETVRSLSSIHVIEHIGLGRYGDPIQPEGTRRALLEIQRVLKNKANLFIAIPIGKPGVFFDAHRVLDPQFPVQTLSKCQLLQFSGVDDEGNFHQDSEFEHFSNLEYGCGMYWFVKN